MNFAEAEEHFRRLKAKDKALKGVELVDVSTPAILSRNAVAGPVCLVGSKTYKLTPEKVTAWRNDYRKLDPNGFTGIDIEGGMNVDVVADLCDANFPKKHPSLIGHFGLVICGALLEHVKNPFDAARNVSALIKPGGHLYYLGPWVWGFHAYPDDYWRFSFSAIRELFPGLEWREWFYASTNKNVGVRITDVKQERAYFQSVKSLNKEQSVADLLTDRAMAYLNVGAIVRRPL